MKKSLLINHLIQIALIMSLLLSCAALFNFIVDPAHLFGRGQYETGVAAYLLNGKNVANIGNYDERLLQRIIIENDKKSRDVIVLGSSRSMQIGLDLFPGESFMNHSVSGAGLGELVAIHEMYVRKNKRPHVLIIGLDPWLLNRAGGYRRTKSLEEEYNLAAVRLGMNQQHAGWTTITNQAVKFSELVSISYLRASWQALREKKNTTGFYATDENEANVPIRRKDGTVSYSRKERERTAAEVEIIAQQYAASHPVYLLGQYYQLDHETQKMFEALLRDLQANGTQVVFFLPPYHPYVYKVLTTDSRYAMLGEAEKYFRSVASSLGIRVIGSYDPLASKVSGDDFLDGMHLKDEGIRKMFSAGVQ